MPDIPARERNRRRTQDSTIHPAATLPTPCRALSVRRTRFRASRSTDQVRGASGDARGTLDAAKIRRSFMVRRNTLCAWMIQRS